jgi:hypothetical protein
LHFQKKGQAKFVISHVATQWRTLLADDGDEDVWGEANIKVVRILDELEKEVEKDSAIGISLGKCNCSGSIPCIINTSIYNQTTGRHIRYIP